MRYGILGSSGQIGAHLAKFLRDRGEIVKTYDISNGPDEDCRNATYLTLFIAECDFVFFLASDVGGSTYLKEYQKTFTFIDNNVRIMETTFNVLRQRNVPFLFASSQMSNMPWSSYGALKAVGEHYCRALSSPIIKFWNVYGIEKDPRKTHVITDFVKMAIKGQPITMKTDGTEERQFLYAEDCSEALYTLANVYANLDLNKEYHITSFKWVSILDIAHMISGMCSSVPYVPSTYKDTLQFDKRNEPDPYIINSGIWKPTTALKDGIGDIIEYERNLL